MQYRRDSTASYLQSFLFAAMLGLISFANFVAAAPVNTEQSSTGLVSAVAVSLVPRLRERQLWSAQISMLYRPVDRNTLQVKKIDLHRVQILNTIMDQIKINRNVHNDVDFEEEDHYIGEDANLEGATIDRGSVLLKIKWEGPKVLTHKLSYGTVVCIANGAIEVSFSFPTNVPDLGPRTLPATPIEVTVDQVNEPMTQLGDGARLNGGWHVLWKLELILIRPRQLPDTILPPEMRKIVSTGDNRIIERHLERELNLRRSDQNYFEIRSYRDQEYPPEMTAKESVPPMYHSYTAFLGIVWRSTSDSRQLTSYGGISFQNGQMQVAFSFPEPALLRHGPAQEGRGQGQPDVVFSFNPNSRSY
ncbi:hypothetical protein F5878DRAFT_664468 [Lentinula raphanica]|uniref:Uncharacterized protein n=1 Tax=Lentinula raphanica TaxID=153919 RepID=A0AA38P2B4_9AGAR|nr:hypothetical protein F5878DRAFT_664468 [Lentinula raphanica]